MILIALQYYVRYWPCDIIMTLQFLIMQHSIVLNLNLEYHMQPLEMVMASW